MFFEPDPIVTKNSIIQERRLGKFYFSNEFLCTTPPQVFKNLFSKVIPIDVNFEYAQQTFNVTAFSEHFEPVDENCEIPQYQVLVKVIGKKKPAYQVIFQLVETNPLSALFAQS